MDRGEDLAVAQDCGRITASGTSGRQIGMASVPGDDAVALDAKDGSTSAGEGPPPGYRR